MPDRADQRPVHDDRGTWDIVIVGAGMGGGTLGHALTGKGWRVLFLERGFDEVRDPGHGDEITDPVERMRAGQWPERVTTIIDHRRADAFPAMGCGVGGSTKIYAAALERFERADMDPGEDAPHPAGPWPVGYDLFSPYYAQAEALFRVLGTRDPLGDPDSPERPRPPAAAPVDGVLMRDLARAGMHPYRLHVGIAYAPGCQECLGRICPIDCKSDAAARCVRPALASGRAELRTGCEVVRIECRGRTATGIVYEQDGRLVRVTAPLIALSAGALRSPALLLLSANADHPRGLANSSGLVGRNLMFHASEWAAIWPSRKASFEGPRKTIAARDLYRAGNVRLGSFQSVGLSAGYGNILLFLYTWFDQSALRWLRPIRPLLRLPARIAARLFGNAAIFTLILEDMPYPENGVEIDPDDPGRIVVRYTIRDELTERARRGRKLLEQRLRGMRLFWLRPDLMLDSGHPCGTCRFGSDPATSVLDPNCRTHDLDNLYVVDASFMPSSAATNPSLTIAANALRVADAIDARLRASVTPAAASAAPAA